MPDLAHDYLDLDSLFTPDELAGVAGEFFAPERQTVLRLGPDRA